MNLLTPRQRLGTVLDARYGLESVIGQGGMSTVFGARHLLSGRAVAVKLLHPHLTASPELRERFMREARAIATLEHPHVVEILDVGTDSAGAVYLVLERLRGESLGSRLRRQPLSLAEVERFILPVMGAAAMAHERGLVHRDLKPDNIFLAESHDGSITPKLLDFGIARGSDDGKLTETGHVLGTARYMAPEQARALPPTPSCDVWSMGALVFRAVSGRPPFTGATGAVLRSLLTRPAPSLREVRPDLPDAVIGAVDSALKTRVEARWQQMGQFEGALRSAIADAARAGWIDPRQTPSPAPAREHTPVRHVTRRSPPGPRVVSLADSVPPTGEVDELCIPIEVERPRSSRSRSRSRSRTPAMLLASAIGLALGLAGGVLVVGPANLRAMITPEPVLATQLELESPATPPAAAAAPPSVQTIPPSAPAQAQSPEPRSAEEPIVEDVEPPTVEPEEEVVTLEPTHLRRRVRRRARAARAPESPVEASAEEPAEDDVEPEEPAESASVAAPDRVAPGALVDPWNAFL